MNVYHFFICEVIREGLLDFKSNMSGVARYPVSFCWVPGTASSHGSKVASQQQNPSLFQFSNTGGVFFTVDAILVKLSAEDITV